ncbi:TPA: hypothetical protein ACH3IE_005505 [Salmonella enterica subsp. enterica serovar Paratyphi B]
MKFRLSKDNKVISEKLISFYYVIAIFTIIFNLSFPMKEVANWTTNMGGFLTVMDYNIFFLIVKVIIPIISIFTGYNAILMTLQYIRQVTEKGGK